MEDSSPHRLRMVTATVLPRLILSLPPTVMAPPRPRLSLTVMTVLSQSPLLRVTDPPRLLQCQLLTIMAHLRLTPSVMATTLPAQEVLFPPQELVWTLL